MSSMTVTLSEASYQRLHRLSTEAAQSPEAVLEEALADYERKLLSGSRRHPELRASPEAELLDDPGRIRTPARDARAVPARVVSVGRQPPRPGGDEE